ncbi:hypothetical protein FOVG_10139 [Fusarium oxysporum f. sp. pisi HDV247]|uniref:Uncharacterized protein n=1 Tax=Fusarium oxysporum f. sp. pisi HDV247 TaxID=1080344 RepID=W9PHF2_FUSOX|nr:hypothetical protein FOVG_10139 [Fusarium oxysporum f. sp. pisi HDV247]
MTPLDAPTTEVCQCTKAKGAGEDDCELDTTVICPDCHLEEATSRKPDDVGQTTIEQAAFPDERNVYIAFKDSPELHRLARLCPSDQSIKKVIKKRERGHARVRKLVTDYGIASLVTSLGALLDDEVFTSHDAARRRFPDLFPEEQVQRLEEGQGLITEIPVTEESQPGDSECNPPEGAAGGPDTGEVENSRHSQTLQDRRLFTCLPVRPQQRLMSQLQLILEHACFTFGQREMKKKLDKWQWTCAEAAPLTSWIHLFMAEKTFQTQGNAESLSELLRSVARIQHIAVHRDIVDLDKVNELLSSADEFVRLLNTPVYENAVKPLRKDIEAVLLTMNRNAASAQKEADKKLAEIEAQRERLRRKEEETIRYLEENLNGLRYSIERDIFTAMGQAKEVLPDIGLADQYCEHRS